MSELTVMDLMRCVFWGVIGTLPVGFSGAFVMMLSDYEKGKGAPPFGTALWIVISQIAFGVACYIAGVKS